MKEKPLVSVVIPCYNHARYIVDCIDSIIAQDYSNIELIIIDDGSSDESTDKINTKVKECKQRFVNFEFRHRSNKGLSATLNEAIQWCQGDFLSCIASDDMMLSDKISFQVDYLLSHKKAVGVFGGIIVIDSENNPIRTDIRKKKNHTFEDVLFFRYFLPAATQMLRLKSVKEVGGYKDGIRLEDWYIYLKLSQNGMTLDLLEKKLSKYRRHPSNTSKDISIMEEKLDILLLFKEYKLIEEARVYVILSIASEYAPFNKIKSLKWLLKAVIEKPTLFFEQKLWFVMLKIIIPNFFLKKYT